VIYNRCDTETTHQTEQRTRFRTGRKETAVLISARKRGEGLMSRRRIKNPKKHGSGQKKESAKGSSPKRQEISFEELKSIVARAKDGALSSEDLSKLDAAVDTLGVLTRELEAKGASILRLRRLIFGSSTEKTRNVLGAVKG
jgi:hypothetical protein